VTPRSTTPAATHPLAQLAPLETGEPLGEWVLESTAGLRTLRGGLHAAVHGPRTVSGPVALVASELATNALRHGVPPATVTLSRLPTAYLLDVADSAVDERPVLAARRPLGEGGFGLYLVGRLADDLGWYVAADRKHVWATIPR
jgi:hypothetical protein